MGEMDEETARQQISGYWQAVSVRDFEGIGDFFADDVLIEWPQSGERVRGKEACLNVVMSYPGGSPRLVGVRRLLGGGGVWISEAELEYPDGKRYLTISVFQFSDDRISHEIDWFAEPFEAPEWRRQWVQLA